MLLFFANAIGIKRLVWGYVLYLYSFFIKWDIHVMSHKTVKTHVNDVKALEFLGKV